MSQTLLHKPPQAVTKLGTRCKYEFSSALMHGTDRGGEAQSIWGYHKITEDNHKMCTKFTLIKRLVRIPVSEIIILSGDKKEKKEMSGEIQSVCSVLFYTTK